MEGNNDFLWIGAVAFILTAKDFVHLFEPTPDLGEVIERPTVERHVNAAGASLTVGVSTLLRMVAQIAAAVLAAKKSERIIGHSLA